MENISIYEAGNKEPFIKLKQETIEMICSFVKNCSEWKLDNIGFELFSYSLYQELKVLINELNPYWEITITDGKVFDFYHVDKISYELMYDSSEIH